MKVSQDLTLLILVLLLTTLLCIPFSEGAKFGQWTNCSTSHDQHQNDGTTRFVPPQGYGFGCSNVIYNKKGLDIFKTRRGKVDVVHYSYNRFERLCSASWLDLTLEIDANGTRVDNCYDYYCARRLPDVLANQKEYYSDAVNYCLYCKNAPERERYLESVADGTCHGLNDIVPLKKFFSQCEYRKRTEGIPLIEYEGSSNEQILYYCYCYKWNIFSMRCDGNAWLEWYVAHMQSAIILFFYVTLLLLNLFFCTIPLTIKSVKQLRTSAYGWWYGVKSLQYQRIFIHTLTTSSIIVQIFSASLHFFFTYIKYSTYLVIVAFYDPSLTIQEACIMCALFFYLSVWVQILYKAKNLDAEKNAPWFLRIAPLPVCIISVVATIAAISVSIAFSTKEEAARGAWKNALGAIDIIWIVCMVVVWIGLAIYGLLIYRLLRLMQKVSPLNLKFTRLLLIFSFFGVLYIMYKSYAVYRKFGRFLPFVLPMRVRTSIVSFLFYCFALILMYAVFNWNDFALAYPFADKLYNRLSTWWMNRKFKKSSSVELREEFLSNINSDDTYNQDLNDDTSLHL